MRPVSLLGVRACVGARRVVLFPANCLTGAAMNWSDYAPFTDAKSFVRVALGVVIILLVLKYTGARKFVA